MPIASERVFWLEKLIIIYWAVRIIKPEWIFAHYLPTLNYVKGLPTILIFVILIGLLTGKRTVIWNWRIGFFLIIAGLSTMFSANRGISIGTVRLMAETLIIASATTIYLKNDNNIRKIFVIYIFGFLLFGIWGIAENGKIKAFQPLDNEDQYGPFMCIGISITYFLSFIGRTRISRIAHWGFYICLAGAVISFARGVFLGLLGVIGFLLLKTRDKSRLVHEIAILGGIGLAVFLYINPDYFSKYAAEMETIWEQGGQEQTGKDRIFLWIKGMEMLANNPMLGVGPNCFTFRLPRYATAKEAESWGVNTNLYGRHLHNIYVQVLAEMGIFGMIAFLINLWSFLKKNKSLIKMPYNFSGEGRYLKTSPPDKGRRKIYLWGMALRGGMLGFLITAFFYNLLDYTWFWDLVIINEVIFNYKRNVDRAEREKDFVPFSQGVNFRNSDIMKSGL